VSFHLIPLARGSEGRVLQQALAELTDVEPGETAFLSESLAWTPVGSGQAFAALLKLTRVRDINVVTTLNLGGELIPDLPGADSLLRYNAVVVFTRHGDVHVPQAKSTPQSFEMDDRLSGPNIAVTGYPRFNTVSLDVDEELVKARFVVGSDVALLGRFTPRELACDLMVVMGHLPTGAENHAGRLLGLALAAGVAKTAMHINAFEPRLAERVEAVLDATRARKPAARWSSPRALRSAVYVHPDGAARDFAATARLRKRRGRIAVPQSRWDAEISLGAYPITVVL
jgi:hypothetical protein